MMMHIFIPTATIYAYFIILGEWKFGSSKNSPVIIAGIDSSFSHQVSNLANLAYNYNKYTGVF